MNVEIRATSNEWDAPLTMRHLPEGKVELRRDKVAARLPNVAYLPHAVVVVDGELSEFDRARQPEGASR